VRCGIFDVIGQLLLLLSDDGMAIGTGGKLSGNPK
jgi:hypothetical protein